MISWAQFWAQPPWSESILAPVGSPSSAVPQLAPQACHVGASFNPRDNRRRSARARQQPFTLAPITSPRAVSERTSASTTLDSNAIEFSSTNGFRQTEGEQCVQADGFWNRFTRCSPTAPERRWHSDRLAREPILTARQRPDRLPTPSSRWRQTCRHAPSTSAG